MNCDDDYMDFGKMGKNDILSKTTLNSIFYEDDEIIRADLIVKAQLRAEELRVLTQFNRMVKAYEKERKDSEKANTIKVNKCDVVGMTNFGSDKYPDMKCGAWICDKSGKIYSLKNNGEVVASRFPILLVKLLRNINNGKVKAIVAYKMRGKWYEITVNKEVISNKQKIIALSDYGLPVTTDTAGALVQYLGDLECFNIDTISEDCSTSKMGWQMGEFFPYSEGNLIFDGNMEFQEIFDSLQPTGSYEAWLNEVKAVRKFGRIEPLFMMAASFASPLLKILNVLSFCVNLWGDTEGGKSVTSKLATSIWANPQTGKYISNFNITAVQREVKQNFLNNLPFVLDDMATVKNKKFFDKSEFIYDLCNEKGKGRSDKTLGIREENTWRQVIIMNGEHSAISEDMQGGAINRVLDLNASLGKIYENPRELCGVIDSNYGHAGRDFIEIIRNLGSDRIKQIFDEKLKAIEKYGRMDKQSASLAAVLTADKIVSDNIFKDGIYISLEEAVAVLTVKEEVSENQRCLDYLLSLPTIEPHRFYHNNEDYSTGEEISVHNTMYGCVDDNYIYYIDKVFDKVCNDGGSTSKKFKDWAKKTGKIITDNKGNPTKIKRMAKKTTPIRCVWIKLDPDYYVDDEITNDDNLPPF